MENKSWEGFNGGKWENTIDVRDFIQKNYQYAGHMMTLPYQCIGTRKQISRSPSDFIYGSINSWKDTVNFFKKCASE